MAWEGILRALWIFLPAYLANMAPVFIAKIIPKWNAPVDGGRVGRDGQRLLGAGKTWRGFVGGAVLGGLMALVVAIASPHFLSSILAGWDYGLQSNTVDLGFKNFQGCAGPGMTPCHDGTAAWRVFLFGSVVGFMALVGDATKSYFKRRRRKKDGAPWFPFDQLDFVVFGLLGMLLASPLLPDGWVVHALADDWVVLATLFVLTPVLHLLVNRIGYWLGLKKVPW